MRPAITGLLCGVLLFGASAMAQETPSGTLTGTATDADGKPLKYATVIARHDRTGARWSTLTRKDGTWTLPGVETGGPYRVRVKASGMAEQSTEEILVRSDEVLVIDFKLEPDTPEAAPPPEEQRNGPPSAETAVGGEPLAEPRKSP